MGFVGRKSELVRQALAAALDGVAVDGRRAVGLVADAGIRSYLKGYRLSDVGRVFENAVFHELLYRGWSVHVGRPYGKEVDFVAVRDGRIVCLQVTDELFAEGTRESELGPLRSIRDNHEKAVIVRHGTYERDVDGIRILTPPESFFGECA